MSSLAYRRHLALTVPVDPMIGVDPVTHEWVYTRVDAYLNTLIRTHVEVITDRRAWLDAGGRPLPAMTWGQVDRARGEPYTDTWDPRAGTVADPLLLFFDLDQISVAGAFAESVIAHEVTHLRYRSLGHSRQFFVQVQKHLHLLREDPSALPGGGAVTVSDVLARVAPGLVATG
jgi:hypothetical protein